MTNTSPDVLVRVEDVAKEYPIKGGIMRRTVGNVHAVSGVTLEVRRGETLGLVGESGSGKSTLGRMLVRLEEPTAGSIRIGDSDPDRPPTPAERRRAQLVFQNPQTSLNPRVSIGSSIAEPLRVHRSLPARDIPQRVAELLELVRLQPSFADRLPFELSGGQRQRVGIARALACDPEFLVLDESIASLDVSVQAQIINLLTDLQRDLGLSYVFITHDLSVARHVSDRIAVMYLGQIVELGPAEEVIQHPQHPYTRALRSAIPVPDPEADTVRDRIVLVGEIPSPVTPPSGCRFRTRCRFATELCAAEQPELVPLPGGAPVSVACHHLSTVQESS
ncbi:ABC transporter ATP-binding protein [Leucobacter celer]|uniref:ABC transporter ATP-binding protein n=1 Tax=Leucobacter celer TaxID=668625 RepID=UPI0006A758D6|nr:ABC transporter ATP-binding protein [Leucobacter celer]